MAFIVFNRITRIQSFNNLQVTKKPIIQQKNKSEIIFLKSSGGGGGGGSILKAFDQSIMF